MSNKLKIDIVSDVVCPWCIIGYKRLEKAISELGIQDKVEIEWQPFELNPHMPAEGQDLQEHIAQKYGSTTEQQKRSQEQLTQLGAELNFKFNFFDGMKMVNTRDAHILIDYAKENGKQTELNLRLISAFFSEQKDIINREVLIQELESIGLNGDEALARLEKKEAREHVKKQENYWQSRGVSAVPTIVFNGTSGLTGAQPVDVYKQVLADLLENNKQN